MVFDLAPYMQSFLIHWNFKPVSSEHSATLTVFGWPCLNLFKTCCWHQSVKRLNILSLFCHQLNTGWKNKHFKWPHYNGCMNIIIILRTQHRSGSCLYNETLAILHYITLNIDLYLNRSRGWNACLPWNPTIAPNPSLGQDDSYSERKVGWMLTGCWHQY